MIGKVARCRNGRVGLVLQIHRRANDLPTGSDRLLYKGIHLEPPNVGQEWQSMHPEIIGSLDDWVRLRYREIILAGVAEFCDRHGAFYPPTKRNLLT